MQEDSRHSLGSGEPNLDHVQKDTKADAVLIADRFTYRGKDAPVIPDDLRDWSGVDLARPGRDHRWKPHTPDMIGAFTNWVVSLPEGCQGEPADW